MASGQGIVIVWKTLSAAGCKGGPAGQEDKKLVMPVWRACFRGVDDRELMEMALGHLSDPHACQWWPQPGLLLKYRRAARQLEAADADLAWGRLLQLVQRRGRYQGAPDRFAETPAEEAAYQRALLACGGWEAICNLTDDGIPSMRACWRQAFRATIQLAVSGRQLPDLASTRPAIAGSHHQLGQLLELPSRGPS